MNIRVVNILVLFAPVLLAGCSGFSACDLIGCGETRPGYTPDYGVEDGAGDELDVGSVTYGIFQIFSSTGVSAKVGPLVKSELFEPLGRAMIVEGSPVLFVEFDESTEADRLVEQVSQDGKMVGEKDVPLGDSATKEPHWFRSDKVIALYIGDRAATLAALALVFKSQFAGPAPLVES